MTKESDRHYDTHPEGQTGGFTGHLELSPRPFAQVVRTDAINSKQAEGKYVTQALVGIQDAYAAQAVVVDVKATCLNGLRMFPQPVEAGPSLVSPVSGSSFGHVDGPTHGTCRVNQPLMPLYWVEIYTDEADDIVITPSVVPR